jgi:CheY-like chemotaxis protein
MQVLGNLLNNALQFTPPEGRISVGVGMIADWAVLTVQDTGSGIEPAFLPFIFESFRQADGGSNRRYGGLGLGLAIVKRLAELHGGSVEAESGGRGAGAIFRVRLPLATPERLQAAGRDPHERRLLNVSILVVEDDLDARELLRAMLQAADATVTVTPSAADALQVFERQRFDVLISDIAMAERDGLDLMRTIRSTGSGIPAIAVTALSTDDDRARTRAAGFDLHLTKPIDQEMLVSRIAILLGR